MFENTKSNVIKNHLSKIVIFSETRRSVSSKVNLCNYTLINHTFLIKCQGWFFSRMHCISMKKYILSC